MEFDCILARSQANRRKALKSGFCGRNCPITIKFPGFWGNTLWPRNKRAYHLKLATHSLVIVHVLPQSLDRLQINFRSCVILKTFLDFCIRREKIASRSLKTSKLAFEISRQAQSIGS